MAQVIKPQEFSIKNLGLKIEEIEFDSLRYMDNIEKEIIFKIYRNMVRVRAFDEKINDLINRGYSITQHATTGQEATTVTACALLKEDDVVMPYHRGWGWAIGKGMDPKFMLAELLGKETGYCKGKGGPSLASYKHKVLGRPGVQGAHINLATGVGLALKKNNKKEVCICFFGNGASNTGSFHESINMAATWKVPVVFIVENNFYEIFSNIDATTASRDIARRAVGYDIPGKIIDGNDAIAVYATVSEAIQRARSGKGPSLIEAKTYRWLGHTAMDKIYYGGYRLKEEVDFWKEKCPIKRLEEKILRKGLATEEELKNIKDEAKEEMEVAEKFALESPYPEKEKYFEDVYA